MKKLLFDQCLSIANSVLVVTAYLTGKSPEYSHKMLHLICCPFIVNRMIKINQVISDS